MSRIVDCLLSKTPKIINIPSNIDVPQDPVSWATHLFGSNAEDIALQINKPGAARPGAKNNEVIHLDPKIPANVSRFLFGAQTGKAVHGRLEILNYSSGKGLARKSADWAHDLCKEVFMGVLSRTYPLGFFIRSTLWLNSGDHRYQAHCDAGDGFLVQLTGRKRVRVWPIPEKFATKPIFNYEDQNERMSSEAMEFDLEPGQILFIPGGAMHDVVAKNIEPAVSVSFHMGCIYPLISLWQSLNRLLGRQDITLPSHMKSLRKFRLYYFEPANYITQAETNFDEIPPALVDDLLPILKTKSTSQQQLKYLLSLWWQEAVSEKNYIGDTPE